MAHPFQPTSTGRRLIALLRQAVATDNGDGIAAISHRLPITVPDGALPTTFTVYLSPDERGAFLVTCRELPEITTFGEDEREALAMAEEAILEALAVQRGSPEFPY